MLSTVIFLLCLILLGISLLFGKRAFALTIVVIFLVTNTLAIFLYYLAPDISNVQAVVAAREITVYLAFFLALFFIKNLRIPFFGWIDRVYWLILLITVALILFSLPRYSISALLMGRELVLPITIYFLFRFLDLEDKTVRQLLRFILALAVLTATLSIIEQVYVNWVDPQFWKHIQVSGYLAQKYGQFTGDFPGSWVNYMPILIGLEPGLRSIGLQLDPLVTGHFLGCSLIICLYWVRGIKRWGLAAVITLGAICTFSKATLLLCFMAYASQILLLRHRGLRNLLLFVTAGLVVMVGAAIILSGDDVFSHFGSFKSGMNVLATTPLGHGVGSTGYLSTLITGQAVMWAIDSTMAVYTYQMGFIGLFNLLGLLLAPLGIVLPMLFRVQLSRQQTPLLLTVSTIFSTYLILAFASAAAFTSIPIFIPMMLLGVFVSDQARLKKQARMAALAPQPELLQMGASL